ncbi:MAG: sensor histidine kinase [Planctomycetota bacterium]|jgi:signal transduction histidine kinase|nr:two-component sensor histidine kinase [Planctomycetota bacterium]
MLTNHYTELAETAGVFIHEIKNHLSTLGLNLQLLAEDFESPQSPRERRALERVTRLQNECSRLVEVSNDFLRFTRVKDLALRPYDLRKVLEELVDFFEPMARSSNVRVNVFLPADMPPVHLDPDLMKQALLNLMLNAQQAMPGGGELTLLAAAEGPWLVLHVIDTGAGIPPEAMENLFKPFFSTKPGGSGLGLPTARKVLEAHGGSLSAQSQPGRGTCFTMRLPIRPPVIPKSGPAEVEPVASEAPLT